MISKRKTWVIALSTLILVVGLILGFKDQILLQAIKYGNFSLTQSLVFLGAKVDGEEGDPREEIPLHWAICHEKTKIFNFLITKGASIHRRDDFDYTPLAQATDMGSGDTNPTIYLGMMRELLKLGADVNARGRAGKSPLMLACGDEKVAELLLNHGADINFKDNFGANVLHHCGRRETIPLLLERGADATHKDSNGKTPLFPLADERSSHVDDQTLANVELMIKAGLDLRARDNYGNQAISFAIENGKDKLVDLLSRHGASQEMTPELEAARNRELAGFLFQRMHSLRRTNGCQVVLRNDGRMAESGRQIFGVKGETVEAWGECPSGGVLHGVVYGNGKVFQEFLNVSAGMGGLKPLQGSQGPVAFTLTPEMAQTQAAWVVTERPAASIRQALQQASAALASKHSVMVGRRGN